MGANEKPPSLWLALGAVAIRGGLSVHGSAGGLRGEEGDP